MEKVEGNHEATAWLVTVLSTLGPKWPMGGVVSEPQRQREQCADGHLIRVVYSEPTGHTLTIPPLADPFYWPDTSRNEPIDV